MNTIGYIERLKSNSKNSEVWWDSSPVLYPTWKQTLLDKYPAAAAHIEQLMPDGFMAADKGLSSVTTNPRLVAAVVIEKKDYWSSRFDLSGFTAKGLQKKLYDEVITEGASTLDALWVGSANANGWISAQVDPVDIRSAERTSARGLELHALARNVMVKVPGNLEGFVAIERLVSCGCSVNITFCFTVSQFQAGIRAIETGTAIARKKGLDTSRCKHVITFMIGRFSCQSELGYQAVERGISLSAEDMRWAELMIYEQVQALVLKSTANIKTLLSSIKVDVDEQGRKRSWHLERTGQSQTCYTLTPDIVEFLVERESHGNPVLPSDELIKAPASTIEKLVRIPYFTDAYAREGIEPQDFCNHEAFINACNEASLAYRRLADYCVRICPEQRAFRHSINSIMASEYGVAV